MIIATLSTKGGVGKTTTAVNLAAALAERKHRVLLIDLDPQASASLHLGTAKADLAPSVADVLLRSVRVPDAVRPTPSGVDLLTASIDLTDLGESIPMQPTNDRLLANVLAEWRAEWDEIIIDCQPGLGPLARLGLFASDVYLVPTPPHFLSLQGIEPLIERCSRVARRAGRKIGLLGINLTMVDDRSVHVRDNLDALRRRFPGETFATEIRQSVKVAEAPAVGRSVFEHAPTHRSTNAYRLLAEEVLQRLAMRRAATQAVEPRSPSRGRESAEPVRDRPTRLVPSSLRTL